jgi:DNA topoisomerase-1
MGIIINEEGSISLEKLPTPKELGLCEKCGSQMVIRRTFRGPFAACSAYPKCRNTKSLKYLTAETSFKAKKSEPKPEKATAASTKKASAKNTAKGLKVKKVVNIAAKKRAAAKKSGTKGG